MATDRSNFEATIHQRASHVRGFQKYAGHNYIPLSNFIRSRPLHRGSSGGHADASLRQEVDEPFVVSWSFRNGSIACFMSSSSEEIISHSSSAKLGTHSTKDGSIARLLFLRGFPSPSALTATGAVFQLNPELARTHLDLPFLSDSGRSLFSEPSLPSIGSSIFQLKVPTLLSFESKELGSSMLFDVLRLQRNKARGELRDYQLRLPHRASIADSIVRDFTILSKQHCTIDQYITLDAQKLEGGWNIAIWNDIARDLGNSTPGPWYPRESRAEDWRASTFVYPILRSVSFAAANPSHQQQTHSQSHRNSSTNDEAWETNQPLARFPFNAGNLTEETSARQDCVILLQDLFCLATSAENQLLNFISAQLDGENELDQLLSSDENVVINLHHLHHMMTSRARHLRETLRMFRNLANGYWPRAEKETNGRKASDSIQSLIEQDYSTLIENVEVLASRCVQEIEVIHSRFAVLEAKKTAQNNERLGMITVLAAVYLPLNLVCAFYGMNMKELGQGSLSLYVWPATIVPAVLLTGALYWIILVVRRWAQARAGRTYSL